MAAAAWHAAFGDGGLGGLLAGVPTRQHPVHKAAKVMCAECLAHGMDSVHLETQQVSILSLVQTCKP